MANNLVMPWVDHIRVAATDPAVPASGSPCRYGSLTGVAITSEDANGVSTIDIGMRVYDIPVTDTLTGGIAAGTALFYIDATDRVENLTTGYFFGFALESVADSQTATVNVLHVPSPGAGSVGAGTVGAGALASNAVETAKILNANVTLAKLAAESVDGSKLAESVDAAIIGGVPILYHYTIPDVGAPTDYDIVVTSKIRVVDAWIINKGAAAHATTDTIQFKNGANAITDAIKKTAATNIVVRAATIDSVRMDIADGGTLKITASKTTNIACEAYAMAYRIA